MHPLTSPVEDYCMACNETIRAGYTHECDEKRIAGIERGRRLAADNIENNFDNLQRRDSVRYSIGFRLMNWAEDWDNEWYQ